MGILANGHSKQALRAQSSVGNLAAAMMMYIVFMQFAATYKNLCMQKLPKINEQSKQQLLNSN